MKQSLSVVAERPRELRRRVMLRARMRATAGWSDACILNVSSRGLMINAPAAIAGQGTTIELWHGDHVIVATVIWRKGQRAGLQADDRVPVDEILALSKAPSLQFTASKWPGIERRKRARPSVESRERGRAIEFVGAAIIAVSLATGTLVMVEQAFARPLGYVRAALG